MSSFERFVKEKEKKLFNKTSQKEAYIHRAKKAFWKNSEARLSIKQPNSETGKNELTGYEQLSDREKELFRFESSYGNIAFGENESGGLTLMVSEKRRHNSNTLTNTQKRLRELNEHENPIGAGRVSSFGTDSAVAFRYQRDANKEEIISSIKTHLLENDRSAANQLMPFYIPHLESSEHAEVVRKTQIKQEFTQKLAHAIDRIKSEPEKKDKEKRRRNTRLILTELAKVTDTDVEEENIAPSEEQPPPSADGTPFVNEGGRDYYND